MRKQGRRIGEQRRGSEPDTAAAAAAAVGECHPGTTCPTFRLAQPLFLNVLYFSISVFWYFCIALFFLFLQKFCILGFGEFYLGTACSTLLNDQPLFCNI